MSSNLKRKAVRGVMWTLADKVLSQLITFIVVILLARKLAPEDFGLIGMLAIFLLVAESLINSGFSQALIQKKNRAGRDYSTVFITNLVLSIFLYAALSCGSPYIAEFYNSPELEKIAKFSFLVLIINALCIVPDTKLAIELNFKAKAKVNFISNVLASILALYMAYAGYGVWAIVAQQIARAVSRAVLLYSVSRWKPSAKFSKSSFLGLFGFGSNLLIAGIVATIVNNLQALLIGKYFGAKDVGYYMQGQRLSAILAGTVTTSIQGVTYPIMTSLQDDQDRLIKIYKKVVAMTAFISFPVMIGMAIIAEPFVRVFLTDKWLPAVPVIQWLCLASALMPINGVHLNILNAVGRSDLFLKVDLIKLPINLAALMLAIPYGIEGVAIGLCVSRVIAFFINAYYPKKLYGYGAIKQLHDLLPIIVCLFPMVVISKVVNIDSDVLQLIFLISFSTLSYSLMAYLLKVSSFFDLINIITKKS